MFQKGTDRQTLTNNGLEIFAHKVGAQQHLTLLFPKLHAANRGDHEIVMRAVSQNGAALQYADDELKAMENSKKKDTHPTSNTTLWARTDLKKKRKDTPKYTSRNPNIDQNTKKYKNGVMFLMFWSVFGFLEVYLGVHFRSASGY